MVVVVEPAVVAGQLLSTGAGHAGARLVGATTAPAGTQQTAGVLRHDDTGLAWSTPHRLRLLRARRCGAAGTVGLLETGAGGGGGAANRLPCVVVMQVMVMWTAMVVVMVPVVDRRRGRRLLQNHHGQGLPAR